MKRPDHHDFIISSAAILLLATALVGSREQALAEDSDARQHTLDITDAKTMPKVGADQVNVLVEDAVGETAPMKAWLQGLKGGKLIWKKPIPIKDQFNSAKMDAVWRGGKLLLMSQFPGSAEYISETFTWNGALIMVSRKQGDPSMDEVVRLTKIAKSGSPAEMAQWEEQDHNVSYPGNYITVANTEKLLAGGEGTALALNKQGKYALAAQRMETCFDASSALIGLGSGGESDKTKIPEKWIEMWHADSIELPVKDWAPKLVSYASMLQKAGKAKQAIQVLRSAIKAEPENQDACLTLADCLWDSNQHTEGARLYKKYQEMLQQGDTSKAIPERVKSRASS